VLAELDGSAEASRSLAGQATSVLGGRIDILVNNAGIYPGDSTPATDEKGALETLTRAWAAEFGPQGVRVNAISPGVVQTPGPGQVRPGAVMMNGTQAGRPGDPEAIAYAAIYLASDEAAFVHGTVLDVDGGRTATAVIAA
jgi:NAD(P)-dependent dehydrogenase (short-subunit alcohol dehydrogenase family)